MPENFKILSESDLQNGLDGLPDWGIEDGGLKREFKFSNFIDAFAFISKVAIHAEKLNHHPEIYNCYNKVIISGLRTHDANNAITTLDIELAKRISKL